MIAGDTGITSRSRIRFTAEASKSGTEPPPVA